MNDGIMVQTRSRKKKNLIIFWVMTVLAFICIIGLVISASDKNRADDTEILKYMVIGVLIFMFSTIPLSYYLALKNYSKLVGENLKVEITDEYIALEDNVEGATIEKKYLWNDISNVTVQIYQAGFMKKNYCLKFVTANNSDYDALDKMQKKELAKAEKREMLLDSRFYIDCSKDDLNRYIKMWGKNFEKEILYFSQIKKFLA